MQVNIDLSQMGKQSELPLLPFHGTSSTGETFSVNKRHLIHNGKPWCPVMGEFHFSRYPEALWEAELYKMKSGGVDIVSTYVFWIHHEEIAGQFDFTGQRNLRKFIELCEKCGLKVWMRIGPWAHGECRNGGFPDWVQNGGFPTRIDDEPYLTYVARLYGEIAVQLKGLFHKDGGPIIGIQLENEYGHCGGPNDARGQQHMRTLKKLCMNAGMIAPFYTATGWGGAVVVENETIPVWGGYVEAPWDRHTNEQPASRQYLIEKPFGETEIGTDLKTEKSGQQFFDPEAYPLLTAELGGGVQVTQHRRPFIAGDDIESSVLVKLACGAALVGYYMYHGGTNPKGKLTTLQESKATGMWNDLPELSYDFQAPLREYGQMHESYGKLRRIHTLMRDFGDILAITEPLIPSDNPTDSEDMQTLRYSIRYGKNGGFLFINNYVRKRSMLEKQVQFTIATPKGKLNLPGITIPDGARWILPFEVELFGLQLKWTTAQLLCSLENADENCIVFFADEVVGAEICFADKDAQIIEFVNTDIHHADGLYKINVLNPNKNVSIDILVSGGKKIKILVLSQLEAEHAIKVEKDGRQMLILSDSDAYWAGDSLHISNRGEAAKLSIYPQDVNITSDKTFSPKENIGIFQAYEVAMLSKNEYIDSALLEPDDIYDFPNGDVAIEFTTHIPQDEYCNLYAQVDFAGESARMYIDGEQTADWFYLGTPWEVELLRYVGNKKSFQLRIEISPLGESDPVFMDIKPQFDAGKCLRFDGLKLIKEYGAVVELS